MHTAHVSPLHVGLDLLRCEAARVQCVVHDLNMRPTSCKPTADYQGALNKGGSVQNEIRNDVILDDFHDPWPPSHILHDLRCPKDKMDYDSKHQFIQHTVYETNKHAV